jgi:hypothetical protein
MKVIRTSMHVVVGAMDGSVEVGVLEGETL